MRIAGRTSWRFAESVRDDLPHVALYVRDALGLAVAPDPAVPPRLVGPVRDSQDLLPEQERQEAASGWAGWWAAVVDAQADRPEAAGSGLPDLRELQARRERVGSPPDFAALVDRPALRPAVVEAFPAAHRWVGRRRLSSPLERTGCFPYRLVRQVAEQVAADRSVDVGDVRAGAVVLDVEGTCWAPAASSAR